MYKISIILPVFNAENTLNDCFNSLINQTIGFNNLEIIFVDDCSTDGSWLKISELSLEYPNVFGFKSDKNSGFAGKPRNIGLNHANAQYVMFLDPDDLYLEDACETLLDIIVEKDVDVVSGNYMISDGVSSRINEWINVDFNDGVVEIENIGEELDILKFAPAVWAKIFKRDFLINNNIFFKEGIPAQDLIFVTQALFEASGIIFIEKPLVNYIHIKSQESTVSTTKTKKNLSKFLEAYTIFYHLLKKKYPEHINLALRHLDFWLKQLIASNISPEDTWDLLMRSHFLAKEFVHSKKNFTQRNYKIIYKLIEKNMYFDAIHFINLLKLEQHGGLVESKIKSKDIILLFVGFDYSIGGLAKAVFNRANLLVNKGHNVVLINIDTPINYGPNILENNFKNLKNIEKHFRELDYISDKISFINMFNYYREKNTLTNHKNVNDSLNDISPITITQDYVIQNVKKEGDVDILNFFNRSDFTDQDIKILKSIYKAPVSSKIMNSSISKMFNKKIVKTENYINNILNVVTIHGKKDVFYTDDGFVYLEIVKDKNIRYVLEDRESGLKITLNSLIDFSTHFIKEMCVGCSEKPFLINECSGDIPSVKKISPDIAYKIGWLHSNPYKEPYCCGSPMRFISILEDVSKLDALVTLTESENKDLTKEFGVKNIYDIPNMLTSESTYINENIKKDVKKLSIFARLSSEKNLGDAIKAFDIVHKKYPDATLNIYGRALKPFEIEEYNRLQDLVNKLNLENVVFFRGHVTNVFEEMQNSLATLCVSKFEGMSMIFLESMVNKTPLISYKLNYGPRDIIHDGIDGILVDQYDVDSLAEKMIYLLENPDVAIKMGEVARKNILDNFTSEPIYNRILDFFNKVYIESEAKMIEKSFSKDTNIINSSDYKKIRAEKDKLVKEYNRALENSQKIGVEKDKLVKEYNQVLENSQKIGVEKDKLVKEYNQVLENSQKSDFEKDKLVKEYNQVLENSQKRDVENDKLTNENKYIKSINDCSKTTIEYYKSRSSLSRKFLFFAPYLYIFFIHKDIILNLKLYRRLKNNDWFNIGYYLNNNPDLPRKKWCVLLTPEVHYICHGFEEKRLPRPNYMNNLSKKELIDTLDKW